MRGSRREQNITIFQDTMEWIRQNKILQAAVKNTRERTVFYPASQTENICPKGGKDEEKLDPTTRYQSTQIEVTAFRSFETAMREKKKDPKKRVTVLNFASATNPGGGVAKGSNAQEESLCRISTLYPCLDTSELRNGYYGFHRKRKDSLYTDACIYTPGILVIKTDSDVPTRMDEKDWCRLDVISCAAPNLREWSRTAMDTDPSASARITPEGLLALLKQRVRRILSVAAQNRTDILILGAFGCGAFHNPPEIAARAWAEVLPEFNGAFEKVHFAVHCRPDTMQNYLVFQETLGN